MVAEYWVTLSDAVDLLAGSGDKISLSTLSRYIAQHAEAIAVRRDGKSKLVDFNVLASHRAENIRLPGAGIAPVTTRGTFRPHRGSQSDGLARKVNADAELREMDLAERRGELTPTVEVEQAGRDAVALMNAAFDRAVDIEAAKLAVRYGWDERVVRLALKGFIKTGLGTFNTAVNERLDAARRRRAAGEPPASDTLQ